jgi:hypothetical protein
LYKTLCIANLGCVRRPADQKGTTMTPPRATEDRAPRTPRWVKISGLVTLLLAAAFLAVHLTGEIPSHGGGH